MKQTTKTIIKSKVNKRIKTSIQNCLINFLNLITEYKTITIFVWIFV